MIFYIIYEYIYMQWKNNGMSNEGELQIQNSDYHLPYPPHSPGPPLPPTKKKCLFRSLCMSENSSQFQRREAKIGTGQESSNYQKVSAKLKPPS